MACDRDEIEQLSTSNSIIAAGGSCLGLNYGRGSKFKSMQECLQKRIKDIGSEMEEVISRTAKNYPSNATCLKGQLITIYSL